MKLLKICGIREKLESYEGIDMLGFNFIESSKRYIFPIKAAEIVTPFSTLRVGVFGKQNQDGSWGLIPKRDLVDIIMVAREAKVNAIQIHGTCDFEYLKMYNFLVIQSVNIDSPFLLKRDIENESVDFYIVDGKSPGSGESYDYSQIEKLNLKKNFLVAGGVREKNVGDIFEQFKDNAYFCGIDVASGVDNGENICEEKVEKIVKLINKNV